MSRKNANKKKEYSISFRLMILEVDRIDTEFNQIDDDLLSSDDIKDLQQFLDIPDYTDLQELLIDLYFRILDPLITSIWLFYPRDFLNYLMNTDNYERVSLSMQILANIAYYGTERIEIEFPDVKNLNIGLLDLYRQYNSIVVRIEKLFTHMADYDQLLEILDELLNDITDFTVNYADYTHEKISFFINTLIEFEKVLPVLDNDITEYNLRNTFQSLLSFCNESSLKFTAELIEYHLNQE